jgi:hypothetical protein
MEGDGSRDPGGEKRGDGRAKVGILMVRDDQANSVEGDDRGDVLADRFKIEHRARVDEKASSPSTIR